MANINPMFIDVTYGIGQKKKEFIINQTPEQLLRWVYDNTECVLRKDSKPDYKKTPQYNARRILGKTMGLLALFCLIGFIISIVMLINNPNLKGGIGIKMGALGLVAAMILPFASLVVVAGKVERHMCRGKNEIDTHLLQDGRIAVIQYVKDANFTRELPYKNRFANLPEHQYSCYNYNYIKIMERVSNIQENSDGVKVTWSGEEYIINDGFTGRNERRLKLFEFIRYEFNGKQEVFPNTIQDMLVLKERLKTLQNR